MPVEGWITLALILVAIGVNWYIPRAMAWDWLVWFEQGVRPRWVPVYSPFVHQPRDILPDIVMWVFIFWFFMIMPQWLGFAVAVSTALGVALWIAADWWRSK